MAERTTELRREIEDTREHLGYTLDAIGDRVSPGRMVERRKNRMRESMTDFRTRVMGAAPSPSAVTESVGETVRHAPDAVRSGAQGSPLVAGGLAFGLGVLVASLLPPTKTEASVAGEVVEPLKAEAADIGKQVGSTAKESAATAGEQAKQTISQAAGTVKSEATSAAQDVKEHASEAAQEVKSTAQDSKDRVTGPS